MPSLDSLIARTQAAIDAESDPRKLRPLQATLAAFLATKAEMDGDDDEDDKGDEESKAAKHRAKAAKEAKASEAAKHRAKAAEYKAKAAESEEAAKKCEEDEEESESEEAAALAAGASAISPAHDALLANLAQQVRDLKQSQIANSKAGLITGARNLGAITKAEAAWLGEQELPAVESFLKMRSKAGLVATSEEALVKPKDAKPGTEESLPTETLEMIDSAVRGYTMGDQKAYREALVKAHLDAHDKQVKAALNGAPGRY